MVSQTLISFKVDSSQLEEFDRICVGLGAKRNKLLNFLVWYANKMFHDTSKLNCMSVYERYKYFVFMNN